jgi:hypothetical protein
MHWWLPRPGARIIRIETEAEAEALISELGIHAYDEARRKESEASSDEIARDWNQVAQLIAARTSLSVDAAAPNSEPAAAQCRANSESSPLDILNSAVPARPQKFRIQMTSAARGGEPVILKEAGVEAADISAAIVAAANLTMPPTTRGLRILDREGREVFARRKADPRLTAINQLDRRAPFNSVARVRRLFAPNGARFSFSRSESWARPLRRSVDEIRMLTISHVRKVQVHGRELVAALRQRKQADSTETAPD